jgi:HD superfamily phosphohydrolase YqeK
MNFEILEDIKTWFQNYVTTHVPEKMLSNQMIQIKLEHSRHVADNCRTIAEELKWDESDILTAEALGLLHDIGRFTQFAEFKTFSDSDSVNHGELGCKVVSRSNILSSISGRHRQCILEGIRHHNHRNIVQDVNPDSMPFLKLIRDADKLDIFRIVNKIENDNQLEERMKSALNLKSDGSVNSAVLDEIRENNMVSNSNVKSLVDFHLMQLSWVFDINYSPTFRKISERRYFERIIGILPDDKEVQNVAKSISSYLETHVANFNNR